MVFVLDKHKKPRMPCTPRWARLLLSCQRAVVHRLQPFTIRLKDRAVQESVLQPVVLKIDPGSQKRSSENALREANYAYLSDLRRYRPAKLRFEQS